MACLDHDCNECGYMWHDNIRFSNCPKCGSTNSHVTFDEYPDYDYFEEDDEEYEEDDDE